MLYSTRKYRMALDFNLSLALKSLIRHCRIELKLLERKQKNMLIHSYQWFWEWGSLCIRSINPSAYMLKAWEDYWYVQNNIRSFLRIGCWDVQYSFSFGINQQNLNLFYNYFVKCSEMWEKLDYFISLLLCEPFQIKYLLFEEIFKI